MFENLETPFFMIHEDLLQKNIRTFKEALREHWPNSRLAYSVKTNSLPWLLRYMRNEDVMAEVVSDEEFHLAARCGYPAKEIVFNGPIKSVGLFRSAAAGGAVVNIDSRREMEAIRRGDVPVLPNIGIRVNVDTGIFDPADVGYRDDGFRFGFSEENGALAGALASLRGDDGVLRIGMHLHCNSVTRSLNVYKALARYAADLVRKRGWQPSFIDIGGGFFGGVEGKPDAFAYMREISAILGEAVDKAGTTLILEPGSAIIGSAVDFHTSVVDAKSTSRARIVTTDGSRINIDPLWQKQIYIHSKPKNQWFADAS